MPPTSSSLNLKRLHRHWQTLQRDERFRYSVTSIVLTAIFFLFFAPSGRMLQSDEPRRLIEDADLKPGQSPRLFIAIGSAPRNRDLRDAIRETWLQWLPTDDTVTYRFFTDAQSDSLSGDGGSGSLEIENNVHGDLVFQPLPTGYGRNENNQYGRRALYQARYFWNELDTPAHFFLRVDDDSFLCLHRLLYELRTLPRRQFFWGRFWCRTGRNRADENFMLFSADVVRLLADPSVTGRLLPFDERVTLGWNFGYWSWVLNLTVFDDQRRLDAQQGYLTKYMHSKNGFNATQMGEFCESHMYAHHVSDEAMRATFAATKTHLMYALPVRRTQPFETCRRDTQSFIPGRHSSSLPHVKIQRSSSHRTSR